MCLSFDHFIRAGQRWGGGDGEREIWRERGERGMETEKERRNGTKVQNKTRFEISTENTANTHVKVFQPARSGWVNEYGTLLGSLSVCVCLCV